MRNISNRLRRRESDNIKETEVNHMGISIVILAYKEEENLKFLLPQIHEAARKTGEEYEILVIDTAEPLDNTKGVCEEFGAKYINQEYPKFGGAFKTGIQYASMDKFLILDGDGSHSPDVIPAIHKKFVEEGHDVVIGSRYVKGGETHDAALSILMSKTLNSIFRVCLGVKAKDISTDFRMYDTAQLKQVELFCENYDVLQEVLLKMKMNNKDLSIGEVPISFHKRVYGDSKRKLLPFIWSYIKTLFRLTSVRVFKSEKKAELFQNLVLYGFFGVVAALIDYGVFSLLVAFGGLAPEIANIISAVCGFAFTFITNTFLNFKKKDKLLRRFLSYGVICLVGMVISTTTISLLKDFMNLYLLKALVMIVVSLLQFVLNKVVTYQ